MATRVSSLTTPVPAVPRSPRGAPPCAMVVFGASGDLTRRKILPALYNLSVANALPGRFAFLGVARKTYSPDEYRIESLAAVREFSRRRVEPDRWEECADAIANIPGEFGDASTYDRLAIRLQQLDVERGLDANRLFYLATPPSEFPVILKSLRDAQLIHPPGGRSWSRVIIEKPFGRDLESARKLNDLVATVLDESQVFRIDHYLGKETVQNIMVLRFANSIFEPLWNRKYVEYVEISALETVGVESRGKFYDETGVLRDVVQNHLLEVLALTAMEPPTTGSADDVRGEKIKVLNALRDPRPDTVLEDVVLGQYRGYREEPGVRSDSTMPTFAAMRVWIDNWRWQGVPFYLRAGKKLKKRVTEVSIHMQRIPYCMFGRAEVCDLIRPNVLSMRIQPDEGIFLEFASKIPGDELRIGAVRMDMSYVETFGGEPPEAYERLVLDAMRGDATLFSRRDWVETSWGWMDPILSEFERHPPEGFPNYDPGSWGPDSCHSWILRDLRSWREL
jgi:glucose-6-phosphate 1-dehydrogenase